MIYNKRKKNEKRHQIFYLSKEHYLQRFYMEPLLIVHQQRFIGTIVIDIGPLLVLEYQQRVYL
jgi:hypothetical protein